MCYIHIPAEWPVRINERSGEMRKRSAPVGRGALDVMRKSPRDPIPSQQLKMKPIPSGRPMMTLGD